MPIEYSIKAIPTLYKGRRYRSRLEAKWACYFDIMQWENEYEPEDLGRWSPDFTIMSYEWPILTEVKPITDFDENIAMKMQRAVGIERGNETNLLLLSVAPRRHPSGGTQVGWWTAVCDGKFMTWNEAYVAAVPDAADKKWLRPSLVIPVGGLWIDLIQATKGKEEPDRLRFLLGINQDQILGMWAAASNAVQWRGKDA